MPEGYLTNANLCRISYKAIRKAMGGKPYTMELTKDDAKLIERVVNVGIDSHLEACFVRDRGDSFLRNDRQRLNCVVSVESFPTLVRRLFETNDEESELLASDMLSVLGFDESGKWTKQED